MSPQGHRGIRSRLLTSNAIVMLLALAVLTVASNAILRRSLDGDAKNLVNARAAAGLATLHVKNGRITVIESPDDAAIDVQIWVFDRFGAVESPTPSSDLLDRRAARSPAGRRRPPPSATRASAPYRSYATESGSARSSPASACARTTRAHVSR